MLKRRISPKAMGIVMAIMLGINVITLGFQKIKYSSEVRELKQANHLLTEENKKLLLDITESETKVIDTAFEKIEEDKSSSLKLIIFESKTASYSKEIKEDVSMMAIEKKLNTAFSYSAALDMSGVQAVKSQNGKKIYVSLHSDMVDVYSINKGEFKITSSKNWLNSFKGTTRDKMSQELISLADREIEQEVGMDFSQRKNEVLNTLKEKLALNYGVDKNDIVLEVLGRQ